MKTGVMVVQNSALLHRNVCECVLYKINKKNTSYMVEKGKTHWQTELLKGRFNKCYVLV